MYGVSLATDLCKLVCIARIVPSLAKSNNKSINSSIPRQGEEWYRHRTAVNRKMLRPKEVLDYVPQMNTVADDFMARLKRLMTSSGHVADFQNEVFKWSMECKAENIFYADFNILCNLLRTLINENDYKRDKCSTSTVSHFRSDCTSSFL